MNMAVCNFFFKSLLTALIVENSHNLIEIYFIIVTKRQWEGWKSSHQVLQLLALIFAN